MLTANQIRAALAAFAGYHKSPEYVATVTERVEGLLALPAEQVAVVLSADKMALRTLPDAVLPLCSQALSHMSYVIVCRDAAPGINEVTDAVYREQRRRRTNGSRTKNAEKRQAATAGLAERFPVGAPCDVHAFGYWYAGRVVAHAKSGGKVKVQYTTGSGVTRVKAVDARLIRSPEEGE